MPRATIRKNLLIGDPDLYRAPRSYPRGSPSGAVYLDEADPQPHHTPSPTGHHRRSPAEEERASRRFSVHFPSALPRIHVISQRWPFSAQSMYTQGSRTITRASRDQTRAVSPLSIKHQMQLARLRDTTRVSYTFEKSAVSNLLFINYIF